MKKLLLLPLSILALSVVGCSGGASEEAPPPKGNKPNVSAPPPGMTGPGQRAPAAGGTNPQSGMDTGEGSR